MDGLITKTSSHDFETTYNKLKSTIDLNPNLKILLELDHSNNAKSVDLNLLPTKIIMFGNPKLGILLMQEQQSVAIDLPQKIIVTENGQGTVHVSYNDPSFLKERHGLTSSDEVLNKISGALDKITEQAIS